MQNNFFVTYLIIQHKLNIILISYEKELIHQTKKYKINKNILFKREI
jgi:hypothetical protein